MKLDIWFRIYAIPLGEVCVLSHEIDLPVIPSRAMNNINFNHTTNFIETKHSGLAQPRFS